MESLLQTLVLLLAMWSVGAEDWKGHGGSMLPVHVTLVVTVTLLCIFVLVLSLYVFHQVYHPRGLVRRSAEEARDITLVLRKQPQLPQPSGRREQRELELNCSPPVDSPVMSSQRERDSTGLSVDATEFCPGRSSGTVLCYMGDTWVDVSETPCSPCRISSSTSSSVPPYMLV